MSDDPPKIAASAPSPWRSIPPAPHTGAAAARFRQRAFRAGFTQIPNVVLTSPRLSATAKVAYAVLCQFAWQDDRAWPHQHALAATVNVHKEVLLRALRELYAHGLVTRERRGLARTNVYWLEPLEPFAEAEQAAAGAGARRDDAEVGESPPAPAPEVTNTDHQEVTNTDHHDGRQTPLLDGRQTPLPLLRKKKTQLKEDTTTTPGAHDGAAAERVVALLKQTGIHPATTRRLVARYGVVACQQQVDWLPLRRPRDAPAVLRKAIEECWLPPGGDPKARLPGEGPYVPLAPPELPVIDAVASDRGRQKARLQLASMGLAAWTWEKRRMAEALREADGLAVDDREGAGR